MPAGAGSDRGPAGELALTSRCHRLAARAFRRASRRPALSDSRGSRISGDFRGNSSGDDDNSVAVRDDDVTWDNQHAADHHRSINRLDFVVSGADTAPGWRK